MRFMLIVYEDETLPRERRDHRALAAAAVRSGVYVSGQALQPALTATTVRVAGGRVQIADGPAVQTPLVLSGCYVLDVTGEPDALAWAREIGLSSGGAVEVRRVARRD